MAISDALNIANSTLDFISEGIFILNRGTMKGSENIGQ